MAYDAMALGRGDARLGVALEARVDEAQFAILSANTFVSGTTDLLTEPYVLHRIAGQTVAIVGLTNPFTRAEAYAADPVGAAHTAVEGVRDKAGIVILLSHAGAKRDARIAREVPGIDVIVSGGTAARPSPIEDPDTGTVLLHAEPSRTGYAGTMLGHGTFVLDAQGNVLSWTWQRRIISADIPEDPAMKQWQSGG
jgi:2',3'-cyclic-nucleotide 2'-phosphodiesterase (5'-nucleotidase family)